MLSSTCVNRSDWLLSSHLFCQQDGGVAVLLAGLGAQSDEPEQEQGQTGAPDHQLPVVVTLQEGLVDVQQLEEEMQVSRVSICVLNMQRGLLQVLPEHSR